MRPIIKADKLGKEYKLGTRDAAYATVREALAGWARAPLALLSGAGRRRAQTVWALRDVSFEIHPGEVVGIIGRNGAGKSTLLKLLSRITEPTTGRAELYGRVGSLLEVGTGFHPELSGRENIYLNGSILGMSRAEIESKFDEIVAFAEVEKFLDTPVKRYSSGMYVRLAFAVAAHLEPEILVVDEVLAVGDHAFQQKCLSKMQDVSARGRTVLFVSHNMGAISRLCQRCILLDQGRVIDIGPTSKVVQSYMTSGLVQRSEYLQAAEPSKEMNLRRVALVGGLDQELKSEVAYHEGFRFLIEYEVARPVAGVSVSIVLYTADGTCAFVSADTDQHDELLGTRAKGNYRTSVLIPAEWLNIGRYTVNVTVASAATSGVVYDDVEALVFNVVDTGSPGSRHGIERKGVLQPLLNWTSSFVGT
ncbi:MAG: lipopolysaccharide transport system ATP-binding protein [Blastocatellia bacterium]|jgi:lipopolysaccharide transport system ATP-binding protein|nr:lipopolysaccharide transport system ATP-binding protein [Blastocatellia bacterium]